MHRLIKKRRTKEDILIDPEFDFGEDAIQRLYLSRNTKRLMEVISNRFAIIYKRRNVDSSGEILPTLEESESTEDDGDSG